MSNESRPALPACLVFRCPSLAARTGGVDFINRNVQSLQAAGIPAQVVWYGGSVCDLVARSIIWALPETDMAGLRFPGRKVVVAQSLSELGQLTADDGWRNAGVEAAIAVGRAVKEKYTRYGVPTTIIHPSVDTALFKPGRKTRTIAYMPRKNKRGTDTILRGAGLRGFEPMPIDGLPLEGVAEMMSRAAVFIAGSIVEGFGLPPLEAMASGCVVVGFAAKGGLEYMRHGVNCLQAEDGNYTQASELLARAIRMVDEGTHAPLVQAGLETAKQFSPEREATAMIAFWKEFPARHD